MHNNHILQPGALVRIRLGPAFSHVAIVSDRVIHGVPALISLSLRRGTVIEESWTECVGQRQVTLYEEQGTLPPFEVLSRARSMIGRLSWRPGLNCEHFARWAHGLDVKSYELRKGLGLTALAVVGTLLLKK